MSVIYVAVIITAIATGLLPGGDTRPGVDPTVSAMAGTSVPAFSLVSEVLGAPHAAGLLLGVVGVPLVGTVFVLGFLVIVIGAITDRIRVGGYSRGLSLALTLLLVALPVLIFAALAL